MSSCTLVSFSEHAFLFLIFHSPNQKSACSFWWSLINILNVFMNVTCCKEDGLNSECFAHGWFVCWVAFLDVFLFISLLGKKKDWDFGRKKLNNWNMTKSLWLTVWVREFNSRIVAHLSILKKLFFPISTGLNNLME